MSDPLVLRTDQDGVATITLNRPARKNAIVAPLLDALADHFEAVAIDESVHAVVLCGAGGAFCSGLDLDAYNADPPPEWLATSAASLRRAHTAVARCPAPVVVALERYAINGGAAFALAGDFVVVGDGAWLQVGEVRIGMVAPMNLAWLAARYPASVVHRVVLRGDRIGADELHRLTIADEVVPDDAVLSRSTELATELAGFPPGATRLMKRAANAMLATPGPPSPDGHEIDQWFARAAKIAADLGGGARPARMNP